MMTKDRMVTWATNALVVAMFAAIPFGAFMAYYTDNPSWLMLCGFLLIFLS